MQLKHFQFEFSIEKLKSNQAYLDFTSAGTRRKSAFPDIAFPHQSRHVKLVCSHGFLTSDNFYLLPM